MVIKNIEYSILLALVIYAVLCFSGYAPSTAAQSRNTGNSRSPAPAYYSDSTTAAKTGLWTTASNTNTLPCVVKIKKNRFRQLILNYSAMKTFLLKAPDEKNSKNVKPAIIELPYPDGSFQSFNIIKSTIMPVELVAKHPELNAYTGINISQPAENVRCECTLEGFKAMITTLKGVVLINNCIKKDSLTYITYYKKDLVGANSSSRKTSFAK